MTAAAPSKNGKRIDVADVKARAAGRWRDILPALCGIDAELLDGKPHACPRCGGKDRLRFVDPDAGALRCNSCQPDKCGDGIAAVQWLCGCTFPEALHKLADALAISPMSTVVDRPATTTAKPALASITDRSEVYSAMLDLMTLMEAHRRNLDERGLDADTIKANAYRTHQTGAPRKRIAKALHERFGAMLLTVPGFVNVTVDGRPVLSMSGAAGILIPVRDAQGRIAGMQIRADAKDVQSRYTWLSSANPKYGGPSPGTPCHCPLSVRGLLTTVNTSIRLTEGGLKADVATALSGFPTIGIPGVGNWKGAVPILRDLEAQTVRLAFDADATTKNSVARELLRCAEGLLAEGFALELERWPVESGKGIDDVLRSGGEIEVVGTDDAMVAVREIAQEAGANSGGNASDEPAGDDGRPAVTVTTDEHLVIDAVVDALASDPDVYQSGGDLVHVVIEDGLVNGIQSKQTPRIRTLPIASIRERIARAARLVAKTQGDEQPKRLHVPQWLANAVGARGQWTGIRPLSGIVDCPVIRADGSMLTTPGYDPQTQLLFRHDGAVIDVPANPTRADALEAVAFVLAVIADFPLASEAHRSAWLAFALTIVGRPSFRGPSPLFMCDANVRGSGKTLLLESAAIIATNRELSRFANPSDDDEARKRITAIALGGDRVVLIDNIDPRVGLGSPALDAALTSTTWKDRRLGCSEIVERPLNAVWSASGNNVTLKADTSRRCCWIRLESPLESPEERTGFQHPDLLAYVRAERPRLLAALLTILRAFFVAGKPTQGLTPWGSFEGWSAVIRECIVWLGLADPGSTRRELVAQSDREAQALRAMLETWSEVDPAGCGLTSTELCEAIDKRTDCPNFRAAILEWVGTIPTARSLGNRLRSIRGRFISGKSIDSRYSRTGAALWILRSADSAYSADCISPVSYADAHAHVNESAHVGDMGTAETHSAESAESASVILHREDGCSAADWWQHSTGSRHCLTCWPCNAPGETVATSDPERYAVLYGGSTP